MMFDDKEWIKKLVNMRDEDQIVIPLYVQIYGKKYSLLELDTIKVRFSEGAFKIGYGTADGLFMPNSFPINRIRDFDVITVFTEYDNEKDRTLRYMVFECGNIDLPEEPDKLSEEIHGYFDMMYGHVKDVVNDYFKALIAEEEHPIIPKEEPKKEEPIVDEEEEDEENDYLDDYVEEDDEEESSEVAFEFEDDSDEDVETVPGLIVETDNTGNEIKKATEVEFITQGNTEDDYLAELRQEVAEFQEEENEDYSTDFDIF